MARSAVGLLPIAPMVFKNTACANRCRLSSKIQLASVPSKRVYSKRRINTRSSSWLRSSPVVPSSRAPDRMELRATSRTSNNRAGFRMATSRRIIIPNSKATAISNSWRQSREFQIPRLSRRSSSRRLSSQAFGFIKKMYMACGSVDLAVGTLSCIVLFVRPNAPAHLRRASVPCDSTPHQSPAGRYCGFLGRRLIHDGDGVQVQHVRAVDPLHPNIRLLALQAQGRRPRGRTADAALA